MKKSALLIVSLLIWNSSLKAQSNSEISELKEKIEKAKKDTIKVNLLGDLTYAYFYVKPDSSLYFAKEALELSEKLKWEKGVMNSYDDMGAAYKLMGNFPKALEATLKALSIAEEAKKKKHVAIYLGNLGNIYVDQGDYKKALTYFLEQKEIQEKLVTENEKQLNAIDQKKEKERFRADSLLSMAQSNLMYSLFNTSIVYQHLNKLDSAFIIQKKAYDIAEKIEDKDLIGAILVGLGSIRNLQHNPTSALEFFKKSIPYTLAVNDSIGVCQTYTGLAESFLDSKNADSCIYYAKKGLFVAQKLSFTDGILNAATDLTDVYKMQKMSDSTVKYLELSIATKDSIFNQTKAKQLQTLSFNEEIRQQEIAEEEAKIAEERMENLQLLGIAVFIFFVIITVIGMSHIKIKQSVIETIGVVSILMLFEFISMFIHPFIEEWTHHSVVLVFLILVTIANIIVPLHHKAEHWMKHHIGKKRGLAGQANETKAHS